MKTKALILMVWCLFSSLWACNQGGNSHEEGKEEPFYKAGQVEANISCRSDQKFSYSLYVPSSLNGTKKHPLIIVFDAHARGKMAVGRFKQAADDYGYIIVASNDARNGIADINPVVNAIWDDVVNRLPVDQARIYTAGFSGGARIAASVAIYKGGVKGVIACGAGMPSPEQELAKKFDYISIVGLNDLNYQELKTLDKAMTENGFVNQMLTFEGTHEWPDGKTLSKAVAWLELMAIKYKRMPLNDKLVRDYSSYYADTINKLLMAGDNYEAWNFYNILLKDLDGIYDISEYKKSYQALLQNPTLEPSKNKDDKLRQEELAKQQQILEWFKSGTFASIKNEALKQQKSASSTDRLQVHQSKRLLGFMGMLSFLYTESSLNSQNKEKYLGFMEIYELLEPKNSDIQFFKACQAMMDNQPDKALDLIQKAIELGFYDVNRLQNIGFFEQLRMKPEFDILLTKALDNFNKLK
jgi:predicted esterase